MLRANRLIWGVLSGLACCGLLACGPTGAADDQDDVLAADAGSPAVADAAPQNTSDAMPAEENAEVYAHSSSTLYRLDPNTLEVTTVADFVGCSSVVDIALDKDSNLYATTFNGLYSVNIATAACTEIATGSYPNSLSFVPAGVLDPTEEVLVAYRGSDYVRIDVSTGEITIIGSIGGGLSSSGDVVSVEGGGTYLTANGTDCNDCLVEINPADGSLQRNWGELAFPNVYGLAFWGGIAYGFDDNGSAFSIEFGANAVSTTPIAFPGMPGTLSFWGAGSTTQAPVIE